MHAGRFLPVALFLAASSSGCGDAASGTTTVEWSINQRREPFLCAALDAASIQIHVVSDTGMDFGTFVEACPFFKRSIYLGRGGYSATAVLLDSGGRPRTLTAIIRPFRLAGDEELRLSVDFPTSIFF